MQEQQRQSTEAESIKEWLGLGAALSDLKTVQLEGAKIPAALIPKGYELRTLEDLNEQYQQRPYRLKQEVTLREPQSFIDYMDEHETDSCAVFCDMEKRQFTGILDYHEGSTPSHCEHRATLKLELTNELAAWLEKDRTPMQQVDFASFIEDMAPEIISAELPNGVKTPSGTDMLQIALTISRAETVNFRSANRLNNGQTQFCYNQTAEDRAGELGDLTIPDMIHIGLPVFKNANQDDGYKLQARFRYRIQQGKLSMWYELVRPERIIEDAVNTVLQTLKDGLSEPNMSFYHGTPPLTPVHACSGSRHVQGKQGKAATPTTQQRGQENENTRKKRTPDCRRGNGTRRRDRSNDDCTQRTRRKCKSAETVERVPDG